MLVVDVCCGFLFSLLLDSWESHILKKYLYNSPDVFMVVYITPKLKNQVLYTLNFVKLGKYPPGWYWEVVLLLW